MSGAYDLADMFARIARELEAASDPSETREVITRSAVKVVPGFDHAGISLIQRQGRIITVAATDDIVRRIDTIQYDLDEGPCLGAIVDHAVYTIDDMSDQSSQWPRFTEQAVHEIGVASMLSFRLFTSGDTAGALNLYGRRPRAFTDESRAVGAILAAHAAIAIRRRGERDARAPGWRLGTVASARGSPSSRRDAEGAVGAGTSAWMLVVEGPAPNVPATARTAVGSEVGSVLVLGRWV
jgi:hypothetical protein